MNTEDPQTEAQQAKDAEILKAINDEWQMFTPRYSKFLSQVFLPMGLAMADIIEAGEGDTILEVGCGDGSFTAELCLLKKPSAKLYAVDLVNNMCRVTYVKLAKLAALVNEPKGIINYKKKLAEASAPVLEAGDETNDFGAVSRREVPELNAEVIKANSEFLQEVIPDASVDKYISSLVLQIVVSPERMIKEAYRVLKPGGRAVFSVWGQETDGYVFTEITRLMYDSGKLTGERKKKGSWLLNDRKKTIGMLEEQGFKNVIAWDHWNTWHVLTEEDVVDLVENFYCPAVRLNTTGEQFEYIKAGLLEKFRHVVLEQKKPASRVFFHDYCRPEVRRSDIWDKMQELLSIKSTLSTFCFNFRLEI